MTTGGVAPVERRGFLLFLIVLAVLACVYLGEALGGDLFVSTETVYRSVQPWSGLEPAPPTVHNENLSDQPTVWLAMQSANRAMVRDWLFHGGEPPLWCPQSYCGAPWFGNLSSALFSPFTWLFVLLPFPAAFAACAAAKWLLAGIGAWLLARKLGSGPAGRALAGVAFAFCGFQVVWIDSCLTNVNVFAPWLLLAIERVIERPGAKRTALLALVGWQVLVGGHPETSYWVGGGAAIYATCRWLAACGRSGTAPTGSARPKLRSLLALLVGGAIAGLLAVVQWWPFLEYALDSFGREQRAQLPDLFQTHGWPAAWTWSLALIGAAIAARVALTRRAPTSGGARIVAALLVAGACVAAGSLLRQLGLRPTLLLELLPDYYGRSLDGGAYGGPNTYHDVTAGFCGAALTLLAVAAACLRARDGRVVAIALAGFVVSLRFFRVPFLGELIGRTPLAGDFGTSRALGMLALALSLLGGLAVDDLIARPRRLALVAAGLLLGAVGLAVTSDRCPSEPASVPAAAAGGAQLVLPENLADPGPSGHGTELHGFAPPDARSVRLLVNGFVRADGIVPGAPRPDGRRPFVWTWVGSHWIDEGCYVIEAQAHLADGTTATFDRRAAMASRPPRPGGRWAVHLGALAAVLLAACLVASAKARIAILLVSTLVELGFFGARYNDTTPVERVPARVDPLPFLERQRRELGPFRVFTARTHLHPNLHLLFDVDVVRGYDALEPAEFIHVLNELYRDHVEVTWDAMDFATLDFAGYPGAWLADLLNVRYALSEEPAPEGWREVWRRTSGGPSLALHENPDVLPRAFTVQRAMGLMEAFARHEDFRQLALWDEPGERRLEGEGRVVASDHARGRVKATVESDSGTILIVSENVAGWRATIDGRPAAIRRTHGTFLSVEIPSGGRHDVELVYRPASVLRGALVSAGGGLLLLALLVGPLLAVRRVRGGGSVAPLAAA